MNAPLSKVQIHPKVALPVFAATVAKVIMVTLAAHGIVLPVDPTDVVLIVSGIVGYLTPSE